MFKYFTVITICGSLLLAQLPGFAARQKVPGAIATVDCVIHSDGTELLWSINVDDSSKPILYYNFEVKVGGGERNRNFTGVGNFTSINKSIVFKGYRKNVSATLKGSAGGANGSVTYEYPVGLFSTECVPSYEGKRD